MPGPTPPFFWGVFMPLHKWADMGEEIAAGWGKDLGMSMADLIRSLNAEGQMLCLLAALVRRMSRLSVQIRNIERDIDLIERRKPPEPPPEVDPRDVAISTGAHYCLLRISSPGDLPIEDMPTGRLSMRAQKALVKSNARRVSDVLAIINGEIKVKNCGAGTRLELLKWVKKYVEPQNDEVAENGRD